MIKEVLGAVLGGIVRRTNRGLLGGVTGAENSRWQRSREADLLQAMNPGREIQPDTEDHFTGDRFQDEVISFENAAAWEEGWSDIRAGHEITGHDNVVPCDLVGRSRSPRIGASGRRRWDR